MRYPASEKLEIIRTVEGSHLPAKQTLDMPGIPRTTFYRWYDRYVGGGFDALADRSAQKPYSAGQHDLIGAGEAQRASWRSNIPTSGILSLISGFNF